VNEVYDRLIRDINNIHFPVTRNELIARFASLRATRLVLRRRTSAALSRLQRKRLIVFTQKLGGGRFWALTALGHDFRNKLGAAMLAVGEAEQLVHHYTKKEG